MQHCSLIKTSDWVSARPPRGGFSDSEPIRARSRSGGAAGADRGARASDVICRKDPSASIYALPSGPESLPSSVAGYGLSNTDAQNSRSFKPVLGGGCVRVGMSLKHK
jgi:hypothetical protein